MDSKKNDPAKLIVYIILLLLSCFVVVHIENQYNLYVEANGSFDIVKGLSAVLSDGLQHLKKHPFEMSFTAHTIKWCGIYIAVVLFIVLYIKTTNKNTASGKEKGSAHWATAKEEKQFEDKKNSDNNMILTDTVQMSMNTRQHRKNCNILVIGGSGTGKSRFVAKPNLMQANCSFVVTDPKGELLKDTAIMFEKMGYVVKVFNLKEPEYSCCYNPFVYIRNDDEVFILVNQLIKNTTEKGKSGGDPFWEKAEMLLMESLFFFLLHPINDTDFYEYTQQSAEVQSFLTENGISMEKYYELMADVIAFLEEVEMKKNIGGVMDLMQFASVKEEDEDYRSSLDLMFDILKWKFDKNNESCLAYTQYMIYKKAAGKTLKSIMISVGARLQVFNLPTLRNLTNTDTLELDKLGDRKTVLFAVLPDDDKSMNFIVAMMYNQLFRTLYYKADFGGQAGSIKPVIPKSSESFANVKKKLFDLYDKMSKTAGDKEFDRLLNQVAGYEADIKKEFGLKFDTKSVIRKMERSEAMRFAKKEFYNKSEELCSALSNRSMYINKYINGEETDPSFIESLYNVNLRNNNAKNQLSALARFDEWGTSRSLEYGSAEKLKELNLYFDSLKDRLESQKEELEGFSKKQRKTDEYLQREDAMKKTEAEMQDIRIVLKQEFDIDMPVVENKQTDPAKVESYNTALTEKIRTLSGATSNNGRLKVHVRFILDEFANLGEIPDFEQKISTMRSREISVMVIIQTISQLKETYKDNWETIAGNCDSWLFIGGTEEQTTEKISKKLGKTTIDVQNTSRSKGKNGSYSTSWQKDGRELLDAAEVGKIPDDKCILFVRGANPFFTKKYRIERHKRYKMLADTNPSYSYPYKERFNTAEQANNAIKKYHEQQAEQAAELNKEFIERSAADAADMKQRLFDEMAAMEYICQCESENDNKALKDTFDKICDIIRKREAMNIVSAKEELYSILKAEGNEGHSLDIPTKDKKLKVEEPKRNDPLRQNDTESMNLTEKDTFDSDAVFDMVIRDE